MSLVTIISELWRFFKNNIVKILVGAVIIAVITMGVRIALNMYVDEATTQSEEQETVLELSDEEMAASYELLGKVYEEEPAEFSFIGMNQEGNFFDNSFIIDEYLTREDVVKQVEEATGVSIQNVLDAEENVGLIKSKDFRGGIAGVRDTSSQEITFRVLVGETPEENLAVAEAYKEIIENDGLPFLEQYELTFLTQPNIGEDLDLESNPMIPTAETLIGLQPQESGLAIIVYGVAGFVLGVIFSTAILFVVHFFGKKITYAYDYSWDIEDFQLMVKDKAIDSEKLSDLVTIPDVKNRIVIAQEKLVSQYQPLITKNSGLQINTGLNALDGSIDEIVILIKSGETDKDWYKHQYELSKLSHVPVKIVHFI